MVIWNWKFYFGSPCIFETTVFKLWTLYLFTSLMHMQTKISLISILLHFCSVKIWLLWLILHVAHFLLISNWMPSKISWLLGVVRWDQALPKLEFRWQILEFYVKSNLDDFKSSKLAFSSILEALNKGRISWLYLEISFTEIDFT